MSTARLALICSVLYLITTIGAGLILVDREYEGSSTASGTPVTEMDPGPTSEPRRTAAGGTMSTRRPTTPTKPSANPSFRQVSAANGLITVIPRDWTDADGQNPTTRIATAPSQQFEARFGGAPPTAAGDLDERISAEATRLENTRDYQRISLTSGTLRDHPMVRWEFEFSRQGQAVHAGAVYWETKGIEYVVMVIGPVDQWPATESVLDEMVDSASP